MIKLSPGDSQTRRDRDLTNTTTAADNHSCLVEETNHLYNDAIIIKVPTYYIDEPIY